MLVLCHNTASPAMEQCLQIKFVHLTTISIVFLAFTSLNSNVMHTSASYVSCNHASRDVRSTLNVSIRSEGAEDTGLPGEHALAFIWVNGKNYAPQQRGYNAAAFDALSGHLLMVDAFNTMFIKDESARFKAFLQSLPQDCIVLLAIQSSAYAKMPPTVLPLAELRSIGAQNAVNVTANGDSHAVIGYKGAQQPKWKDEHYAAKSLGPSEIAAMISIRCSYVPEDSSICSPFNVAAAKYGGTCKQESSSAGSSKCGLVVDDTTDKGWVSFGEDVGAWITIGFHTEFTVNKLRIKQPSVENQRIKEISLEFSDRSSETISLKREILNFQEFTFISRQVAWVNFTVKTVFTAFNAVGIDNIEFYNDMCAQHTLCDVIHVDSGNRSSRYRLDTTKFPFMINAKEEVHVLLTSDSRATSPRYEIEIGAYGNTKSRLIRYSSDSNKNLLLNVSTPLILMENETRSFWVEIENDRVVFGSGEKIHLFWREAFPIKIKYAFFSSPKSSATVQICGAREPDACADGWQYFDGSCYKILDSNTTFSAARSLCLSQKADLVKISSSEENAFVSGLSAKDTWIGLQREQDGFYYWKDGTVINYSNWKSGNPGNEKCVLMDRTGMWSVSQCSANLDSHACELVPSQYLGCYHDNTSRPLFSLAPGSYGPDKMTPSVCRQICGGAHSSFAALKQGHFCLCSNSTSSASESAPDLCLVRCRGNGNLTCGGETHFSVYRSAKMSPASLTLSADSSSVTFTEFNVTLILSSPAYQIVESYAVDIGDGSSYQFKQPSITHVFLYPGKYVVRGQVVLRHNDTGERAIIESYMNVTTVSNMRQVEVNCPSAAPVNQTFNCFLTFNQGADLKANITTSEGKELSATPPDAEVLSVGIISPDPMEDLNISEGLYVLAGMQIKREGQLVAVELGIKRGGYLNVQVYRPSCLKPSQRYCPLTRLCINQHDACPTTVSKSCDNQAVFSFSQGVCGQLDNSCCRNNTIIEGNYDYTRVANYLVYVTSGQKRLVFKHESKPVHVSEGDVIGVHFPDSGFAATLKTISSGFALFYPNSIVNKTGTLSLRSYRSPLTVDSPQTVYFLPAVEILYSTKSKLTISFLFSTPGNQRVSLSIGNKLLKTERKLWVTLQEAISSLNLTSPEVIPSNETTNLTSLVKGGTNVTYFWDFGNGTNITTKFPWVTHVYKATGPVTVKLVAMNKVSLNSAWCSSLVQERIKHLKFERNALRSIENGTTAFIGWQLRRGSQVEFSIDFGDGSNLTSNSTYMKIPGATLFAIVKKNYTLPSVYQVTITASNLINNLTITGNLSVLQPLSAIAATYPSIVRTNETFNITILPHKGNEVRYTLRLTDGTRKNSSQRIIPHLFSVAGRHKFVLIAANDISSATLKCNEVSVFDGIEGLELVNLNRSVGVNQSVSLRWRLNQGTEVNVLVDFADGCKYVLEQNVTIADVFEVVSLHNYSKPGEYFINITASNPIDSDSVNAKVDVETPVSGLELAVARGLRDEIEDHLCTETLFIKVNETVTARATIANGTAVNLLWSYGDGSNKSVYFKGHFPAFGVNTNHSYRLEGEYNISVTSSNRNPGKIVTACHVIVQYPVTKLRLTSNAPRPVNGTVNLNVSTLGHRPTGPFSYHWIFGHGYEKTGNTDVVEHRYGKHGLYNVSVNVSNEISFGVASLQVEIQQQITGLDCSSHVTNYVNDVTRASHEESFVPAQGWFPVEYDVFFNASIKNGTSVTYVWNFDDDSDGHTTEANHCLHKFTSPRQYRVVVTAKNNVSSESSECNITVEESIWNVTLRNDGPGVINQTINFTLTWEKAGTDSCFNIQLKPDWHVFYKHGAPSDCNRTAGNILAVRSAPIEFAYKQKGVYSVKLTATNNVSRVVIDHDSSRAVVTKDLCQYPGIEVIGIGRSLESKTVFNKSQSIDIKTLNSISCYNESTKFRWELYKLNESNTLVNLTKEKIEKLTTNRSTFHVPARFLPYGNYALRFSIQMIAEEAIKTTQNGFIQIEQSPLFVFIKGGSERTVAHNRSIVFNATDSHDPDMAERGDLLAKDYHFEWYCKRHGGNYKKHRIPTSPPATSDDCFHNHTESYGYEPELLKYSESNATLTLNTIMLTAGSSYTLSVVFKNRGRPKGAEFYQKIEVQTGDPPELSVTCLLNCGVKMNPSSKFTLQAKGKCDDCQPEDISYTWEVQKCQSDPVKCNAISGVEKLVAAPLTSSSLVIKRNSFEGGFLYKCKVTGVVKGRIGYSTLDVKVNEPPKGGSCSVSPSIGTSLDTSFQFSCADWKDSDQPLTYEFFYKSKSGKPESLGVGLKADRNVTLPPGSEENNFSLDLSVIISDSLKATESFEMKVKVKKLSLSKLKNGASKKLDGMFKAGNIMEATNFALVVAEALDQEKSKETEFRQDLLEEMVENIPLSEETPIKDVSHIVNTINKVSGKLDQNANEEQNKLSAYYRDAADSLKNKSSDRAELSEDIDYACLTVFGGIVNVIQSVAVPPETDADSQSRDITEVSFEVINKLTNTLLARKIEGEEDTTLKQDEITLAAGKAKAEEIANKVVKTIESEVQLPSNLTSFSNATSLEHVHMVSSVPLYSYGRGADLVNGSKQVSFTFYGQSNGNRVEMSLSNLTQEISIILPRDLNDSYQQNREEYKMKKSEYNFHSFNIDRNSSTIHIVVQPEFDVEILLFVKRGEESSPSVGVYDFNATLPVNGFAANATIGVNNATERPNYEFFLSNTMVNWSAAGYYSCAVGYKIPENGEIFEEATMKYTFFVYTSSCLFFDTDTAEWSTKGCKVGPKTTIKRTQCLCTHLTTFGSSFFVAPNKINFKNITLANLLKSPLTLIAVCVVLGLYFLCVIPARRADRNDAMKTGLTPLPDNDSRDTYCYEIHVHTGFSRGSGSSASVSMVLTGALGDSEPRTLKDPNRKIFKTGAVDAFLLTLPQSLGNMKQIRVWHDNEGGYPSWYLLRVMIQDIQTDQRWWFVCDDWLAVDESDGKIEKTLYPASKKDLTRFNVLFTSEVRKNLTDGHIWFSVVARPSRSNFTRVQRLTCCLSILLSTMVANAMWYEVGKDETPQNAIKIFGLHFSIRQLSIGVMSSLIVFPANLIIVTLFRKAKPKANRYTLKTNITVAEEGDDIDMNSTQQNKKQAQQKGLPHWFVYVAYFIAFAVSITSGSFVVFYGIEFGLEKSAQWLLSMTISFVQDVLLMQPVKVFILATLFALLIKDPKKAEETSYTNVNALASDEEWLHKNTEDLDPEMQKKLKKLINDKPPDEAKLEIARQLRMKEKQMKSIIREIAWYVIFLLTLLIISYGNRDLMTFNVTSYMRNIFERAKYSGKLPYNKVRDIKHWWEWLNRTLVPSMYPQTYYDQSTLYPNGFVADIPTAWILGVSRLRQLRIKKNSCHYKRVFYNLITECNDFYSMENEEQGSYLPGWKAKPLVHQSNRTAIPTPTPSDQVKGPWDYQSGSELKTFPYWGYKATYSAGGYVQELSQNGSSPLHDVIRSLISNNWLDRYTRAIFTEFTIYNANTNLFCVVTLLFEQLPTGSLQPYPNLLTLRLFRYVGGEMYFVLACEVVYLLFCVFFVFKEVRLFVKKGREHLTNPWSVLEILLTLLSLSAVTLYFIRLKFTKNALSEMRNSPTDFVSFHYTAFLDEWLKCIMGIIVFLSFLKLFRLLRFNRRMSLLQQTIKRCAVNLLSFMFFFSLAFLAFALVANLVFGQFMEGFGTFFRSCASLMDTILGKFTLKEMMDANRIIGPIFFYTYTVSMIFVLINMFLSIINDAFAEVRSDVNKQSNDYEIVDFMIHRLKENIGKSIGHAIRPEYKEPKSELECKFDRIEDNADNAMHFMRNVAFEDMRKTRWFQVENCTEKKKNLLRLLMEVEWDYYEEELCDSIPVFEKFLVNYSNEDLENCLRRYRQKRLAEELAFDRVNGSQSDSSMESQSDHSDSDVNSGDDDIPSNDENGLGSEHDAEDGKLLRTLAVCSRAASLNRRRVSDAKDFPEEELRGIKSPAVLVTDIEAGMEKKLDYNEVQQAFSPGPRKASRSSLEINPQATVSDNVLMQVLQDVERDSQSRCATDAELDSILGGVESRSFDSDPGSRLQTKNAVKKRTKKKVIEKSKEKNKKEAWVGTAGDQNYDDDLFTDTQVGKLKRRKRGKKKLKKEQIEATSSTANEFSLQVVTGENTDEITGEVKMKKKSTKSRNKVLNETFETIDDKQEILGEGKKKNKQRAKKNLAAEGEDDQMSVKVIVESVESTPEGNGNKNKKKKRRGMPQVKGKEESEC